jgi:Ankyrin repeats (many copies)
LPLKVSDSGEVINNNVRGIPQAFMHNLDVFGGNSGGPVFNANGYIEGITVWGPNEDFYFDESTQTIRQTINWAFDYMLFGEPDNNGNIAYRIMSTNKTLMWSMVHRNLDMSMEANNMDEFEEWCGYSWIFNEKFSGKDHLLAMAIKRGKTAFANRILQENGLNINETDYWGNPLISVMAQYNAVDQFRTAKSKYDALDVNLKNGSGTTALMIAASYGYSEMVRALLDAGANASIEDNSGNTARKIAKKAKYKDIAKMLKNAEKGKSY